MSLQVFYCVLERSGNVFLNFLLCSRKKFSMSFRFFLFCPRKKWACLSEFFYCVLERSWACLSEFFYCAQSTVLIFLSNGGKAYDFLLSSHSFFLTTADSHYSVLHSAQSKLAKLPGHSSLVDYLAQVI